MLSQNTRKNILTTVQHLIALSFNNVSDIICLVLYIVFLNKFHALTYIFYNKKNDDRP